MKSSALETPMMKQYLAIKARHPDAVLFYRMGDFYEMFLADAELAAPLLDIALTTRDKGKADAVPMCGIPVHSADQYIKQLAALGHRVAICEQIEDPRTLGGRRLVKRDVVEVVTPGLVGDPEGLDGRQEVSLVALALDEAGGPPALAALDASTGDFRVTSPGRDAHAGGRRDDGLSEPLIEEIERIAPRELLVDADRFEELSRVLAPRLPACVLTPVAAASFEPADLPVEPAGFGELGPGGVRRAAAALLRYLGANQPASLDHLPRVRGYELVDTVVLDAATRNHLELFENSEDRGRSGTLIALLDRTRGAPGARRLARWVAYPLRRPAEIRRRQDAVAWLMARDRVRSQLREAIASVRDLERILHKAARPTAVPRDLGALRDSLLGLPEVAAALAADGDDLFARAARDPLPRPDSIVPPVALPELAGLLTDALVDDPPVIARGSRGAGESGYIRTGFRAELDAIHESAQKGREWIAGLEASERQRSGIGNLKVRYHPVHGYSLEVSKSQLEKVPSDYERKQTLANVERFTTGALREVEGRVMGASERAAALEREIFEALRQQVVSSAGAIREAAERVAELDALASLAEVGRREGWTRPEVDESDRTLIRSGRHPVVESSLRARTGDGFVPNDTHLDSKATRILLLTGPNMSGKSTYLRQVALITLMAQVGSCVPAESARIGAVDRIFTRVGASDRLSRGESTFMVEMRETAEILRLASRRSLIILDEIGRGTSTFDGLSIAWAVAEYLHDTPGLEARTLFATHYHELIAMAKERRHMANAHFEVREWQDDVIFLRRLVDGGANRSYGIQVAKLAGLPPAVVQRARAILARLESGERQEGSSGRPAADSKNGAQLAFALATPSADASHATDAPPAAHASADERSVLDELAALDPDRTAPLDALLAVQRWRSRLKGEGR